MSSRRVFIFVKTVYCQTTTPFLGVTFDQGLLNETIDFAELVFTEETVTDAVIDTTTAKPQFTTAPQASVSTYQLMTSFM